MKKFTIFIHTKIEVHKHIDRIDHAPAILVPPKDLNFPIFQATSTNYFVYMRGKWIETYDE